MLQGNFHLKCRQSMNLTLHLKIAFLFLAKQFCFRVMPTHFSKQLSLLGRMNLE